MTERREEKGKKGPNTNGRQYKGAGAGASAAKNEKLTAQPNKQDPSKFYSHFLHKAVIVVIFLVTIPLIPSQAPEFVSQTLLTRNWELLHLVFVGIAISYGLFSRRNDETEKENNSKIDNAQSIVSRFLQVSSLFEDEGETETETSSGFDENKVQTWNNQYHRNQPSVVVAAQHSNFAEQSVTNKGILEKPLLLPIRSLKSRVSDSTSDVQSANESSASSSVCLSRSSSNSGSKRFPSNSNKVINGQVENKSKESVVLPSPIPWRSRSGRLEKKQEADISAQYVSSPSMEESEFSKLESRSIKSQTLRSSRPNFMSSSPSLSSPKGPSPSSSPSLSSESLAKNAEDLVRKKGFYKSFPPPPPPPPPPMFQKSISMKPKSSSLNEEASFDKELKRSFTSERGMEAKTRGHVENTSMGKSVRTVKTGQNVAAGRREREFRDQDKNQREAEEDFMEESKRKTVGYEHVSFRTDKLMGHGSVPPVSEPGCLKFPEQETESFLDKVIVESDEDTETEDDEVEESFIMKEDSGESSKTDGAASSSVSDEGPDVDKKADEFIAKFREQIRLQRIESIKRSARNTRNSSRLS